MNSALAQSIADLSNRWHNRFSHWRKSSKSGHLRRGVLGEKLACRYLKRNGYKVLFCNFRGRTGGEIDVVCRDNDTLVFVEVKTRGREDFGRPFEAVDREKQKRISRGARSEERRVGKDGRPRRVQYKLRDNKRVYRCEL